MILLSARFFRKKRHLLTSLTKKLSTKDVCNNNYISTTFVRLMAKFDMVSIFEGRYWKINFELFTFHLKYFKDKVSNRMKTSIETYFYYLEYIKNSFICDYFNVPI